MLKRLQKKSKELELNFLLRKIRNTIFDFRNFNERSDFQKYLNGQEYGIEIFFGRDGDDADLFLNLTNNITFMSVGSVFIENRIFHKLFPENSMTISKLFAKINSENSEIIVELLKQKFNAIKSERNNFSGYPEQKKQEDDIIENVNNSIKKAFEIIVENLFLKITKEQVIKEIEEKINEIKISLPNFVEKNLDIYKEKNINPVFGISKENDKIIAMFDDKKITELTIDDSQKIIRQDGYIVYDSEKDNKLYIVFDEFTCFLNNKVNMICNKKEQKVVLKNIETGSELDLNTYLNSVDAETLRKFVDTFRAFHEKIHHWNHNYARTVQNVFVKYDKKEEVEQKIVDDITNGFNKQ